MNIEKPTLFQGDRPRRRQRAGNGFWVHPPFWRVRVGDRVSGVGRSVGKLCVGIRHETMRLAGRPAPNGGGDDGVKYLFHASSKCHEISCPGAQ